MVVEDGQKPDLDIFHAARSGSVNLVKEVLGTGQPMESLDESHRTPLHLAAQGSHKDIVEYMLNNGASARTKTRDNGLTPLHEAESGEVAELLINGKADVNVQDDWGMVPLHHASKNGFVDVIKCLTHYKAHLNNIDGMGRTALHLAAQHGHVEVVQELASAGSDLHTKDQNRRTALDTAKMFGQKEVVKVLEQMDSLLIEGKTSLRDLPAGSPARLSRGPNNSVVERPKTADLQASRQAEGSEQATGEVNRLSLDD